MKFSCGDKVVWKYGLGLENYGTVEKVNGSKPYQLEVRMEDDALRGFTEDGRYIRNGAITLSLRERKMTIQDLKTGMVIEYCHPDQDDKIYKGLIVRTNYVFVAYVLNGEKYTELEGKKTTRLLKVWEPNIETNFLGIEDKLDSFNLIFEAPQEIEISIKINGKEKSLKDVSEETLLKIRNM